MPSEKLRKKGVTNEKFDSCVSKVKKNSPNVNAYAVCNSKLGKKKKG